MGKVKRASESPGAYHPSAIASPRSTDRGQGRCVFQDSRNIGWRRKKAQKMGVDLGAGFEEKLEKLRSDPGSVIRDSE